MLSSLDCFTLDLIIFFNQGSNRSTGLSRIISNIDSVFMNEFDRLLQTILDDDIAITNAADDDSTLPNIALRALKTVNLVVYAISTEGSPNSVAIRTWLKDCLPKLVEPISVCIKVYTVDS